MRPSSQILRRLLPLCVCLLSLAVTAAAADPTLLNASYDVTRELYKDVNQAFVSSWKQRTGQTVVVSQSHGGSSAQVRSVIEGLEADVVTMNQALDIDTIAEKSGLVPRDWSARLPNHGVPFTSTILFLVRKGNPKHIQDWADLVRPDVVPIIPNPKTSGNGRYSYLAAWAYASKQPGGSEATAIEYVKRLFNAVPVLDSGGRGATVTFAQRGIGDVLLTFENEARLAAGAANAEVSIVVPSVSILAENPVAVVETVAARKGTAELARAYLEFLFTEPAQEIGARHFFRPVSATVLAKSGGQFPQLALISVAQLGGWAALQKKHFVTGGVFDQIYGKSP